MGMPEPAITPEVWEHIFSQVEEGQTLRQISTGPGMPTWEQMRHNLRASPALASRYARARVLAAEAFEDRLLQEVHSINGEDTAAMRLRIDTLKWIMSKRAPARYGEKTTAEQQADAPAQPDGRPRTIRRVIVDPPARVDKGQ
ncbi:hypothetical protein GOB86_10925 [Acetobacter lambici]|uniref:Terminase small subunit n=2 Tax=Acetobacter lambici TaxID=1332824 RepID=A0ABT1EYB1_9PROT|nr:hypothetical protein [Acetobacter lambici]MCP1257883.1 hypothetical protein [Acetobacter lambici]NHO57559.1 hypothetical protein [Acetobacter lambici]